jgi:hypothetical protein
VTEKADADADKRKERGSFMVNLVLEQTIDDEQDNIIESKERSDQGGIFFNVIFLRKN